MFCLFGVFVVIIGVCYCYLESKNITGRRITKSLWCNCPWAVVLLYQHVSGPRSAFSKGSACHVR